MHQSILSDKMIKRLWYDIRLALLMLLMAFTALEGEWRVQNLLHKFREVG
jgi:hypothetical protein